MHAHATNGVFRREQTVIVTFDHGITFAYLRLQFEAIQYRNVAAAVADQPRPLQSSSSFCDAFSAHAQHIGDPVLRQGQFVSGRPVGA